MVPDEILFRTDEQTFGRKCDLSHSFLAAISDLSHANNVASLSKSGQLFPPTMTSSLRNSIHRRNHKERAQLAHRKKLGILEKHKDYVKRARDYHSKQDRLTRLKQKAAERNKDEFYFSMIKEKTKARFFMAIFFNQDAQTPAVGWCSHTKQREHCSTN